MPQHKAKSTDRSRRSWPSPREYNEAVQNPSTSFSDFELQQCIPQLDALGMPKPVTGNFASIYKVSCGAKQYAVRCFLQNIESQEQRYRLISDCIMSYDLPWTLDFEYLRQGILVGGEWFPILKMEWVDGETLDSYIARQLENPDGLRALKDNFLQMCSALEDTGIAHGDLQHGNILVTEDGELQLVDYDGMYVPSMRGWDATELGHRNYQHPNRSPTHFNEHIDNFSAWSIYLSLMVLLESKGKPRFAAGNDRLLFHRKDYDNPQSSRVFQQLFNGSSELAEMANSLQRHTFPARFNSATESISRRSYWAFLQERLHNRFASLFLVQHLLRQDEIARECFVGRFEIGCPVEFLHCFFNVFLLQENYAHIIMYQSIMGL